MAEFKIEAQVYPVNRNGVIANVTFIINKFLYCTGFSLRQGQRGVFLSSPSYKDKDGKYHDITFANKAGKDALLKLATDALKTSEPATDADDGEKLPF